MKKLKLDLDAIAIESFEPVAGLHRDAGTVRGRSWTDVEQTGCCYMTEPGWSDGTKCTLNFQSCYATQCEETNEVDCSDVGWCSVQNCHSIGVC